MAGLVPAIHDLLAGQDVDARHKAGHDAGEFIAAGRRVAYFLRPTAAKVKQCPMFMP